MLVGVAKRTGSIGTLTIGGSACTSLGIVIASPLDGYTATQAFYYKNPPSGSYTLSYTDSVAQPCEAILVYFIDNVNQQTPISGSYSYNASLGAGVQTYAPIPSQSGDLIIDFISNIYSTQSFRAGLYKNTTIYGLYQNEKYFRHTGGGGYQAAILSSYRISASSIQPSTWMAYDNPSYFGHMGFSIKGANATGTYDSYTMAMLHFDSPNNSYTFKDEIGNHWTPYRYPSISGSGAIIKTDQYKFGTGSGYFEGITGSEDWIETSTDFSIGSQDFTAECYIRPNLDTISSGSPNRVLFGIDNIDDQDSYILFWIVGSAIDNQRLAYTERVSGSYIVNKGSSYIPLQDNVWQHIAYVKQGNQMSGYLNGTLYLSGSCSSSLPYFVNSMFRIANTNSHSTSMYRGYMDEFRLSIGIARWTSDFTPPTSPYGSESPPTETVFYKQPVMYSSYPWM
jgi:hypothetical protein